MEPTPHTVRGRGRTAIDGALGLMIVLLIVQIWLLTATLNTFLAGDRAAALPGAVVSAILFLSCLAFYFFVERLDTVVQQAPEGDDALLTSRDGTFHQEGHEDHEGGDGRSTRRLS